jgi:hypothetical protein
MGAGGQVTQERFLARASLADERAARSNEHVEMRMWEDIAQCWRELARPCAAKTGRLVRTESVQMDRPHPSTGSG